MLRIAFALVVLSSIAVPAAAERKAPPKPCTQATFDQLMADGKAAYVNGQSALALTKFEAAYACKEDMNALGLATISACLVNDVPKARTYWKKLPPRLQSGVEGRCKSAKVIVNP